MSARAHTHPQWTDRLAFDVALALEGNLQDLTPVVRRHFLDAAEFTLLLSDPTFLKAVLQLREEIAAKGVVFQARARALAEDVLHTTHALSRDVDVSPAVRLQAAQSVVRWSGYDKPGEAADAGTGGGVTISINIGGDHRQLTVGGLNTEDAPAREAKPLRYKPEL